MTGGPHLSATAGEGRRRKSCWAGSVLFGLSWADGARTREKTGGRQRTSVNLGRDHNWAGREIEWLTSFFFFSISIPFLNQSNQIEFKPGFES
jgi:hypothetical protein